MKIQVIKRDGRVEEFMPEKIARVVNAAGLTDEDSIELASRINDWVKTLKKPRITSLEIREKVIEELKKVDEYTANLFIWYQKTKENPTNDKI